MRKSSRQDLYEVLQYKQVAEEATGCPGAGDYREWARRQGYPHCAVVNWTSSAGNWTFIISRDESTWYVMCQENNYPRRGFSRVIDLDRAYHGTSEEVIGQLLEGGRETARGIGLTRHR